MRFSCRHKTVREVFVKGLLQCLIQKNSCIIGGGWGSSCYCYVVVITEIKQTSFLFSLPFTNCLP